MDLHYALSKISDIPDAGDLSAEADRAEAAQIIEKVIKGLGQQVETLTKKLDATERVMYLLVQNVSDETLRDEMNAMYTRISSGLASPEE